MFENISIGLDIASALSIIGAAIAFIWNSINSKRKEYNERKRERLETLVFNAINRIHEESYAIINEVNIIADNLAQGETTQNLNEWRDKIYRLPDSFSLIILIDRTYLNTGKFIKLTNEYKQELHKFLIEFSKLVDPKSNIKWDFWEVMNKPEEISLKYISLIYQEMEEYLT